MVSKVFLLLSLLAIVLFISSEVAAKDLAQSSTTSKDIKDEKADTNVEDAKYGGYQGGGYPGGGYQGGGGGYPGRGGYPGGGYQGGGGYPGGGRGGYGGRGGCRYGCCYRGYNGCRRCCAYAGEVIENHVENKPHN